MTTPRYTRAYHPDLADKMEARVAFNPLTGCWDWTKGVNADGYGYGIYINGKQTRAHRAAFLISNDGLPSPEFPIRHLCGNPRCCRPDHLAVGTAKENAHDTLKAGRHRSRREPLAIRKARAVAMRKTGGKIEQLAARYGISRSAARRVVLGHSWANLPGARAAQSHGEHARKLTEDNVRAIRKSDEPNKVLAQRYSVTAANINAVRKRVSWKHVV